MRRWASAALGAVPVLAALLMVSAASAGEDLSWVKPHDGTLILEPSYVTPSSAARLIVKFSPGLDIESLSVRICLSHGVCTEVTRLKTPEWREKATRGEEIVISDSVTLPRVGWYAGNVRYRWRERHPRLKWVWLERSLQFRIRVPGGLEVGAPKPRLPDKSSTGTINYRGDPGGRGMEGVGYPTNAKMVSARGSVAGACYTDGEADSLLSALVVFPSAGDTVWTDTVEVQVNCDRLFWMKRDPHPLPLLMENWRVEPPAFGSIDQPPAHSDEIRALIIDSNTGAIYPRFPARFTAGSVGIGMVLADFWGLTYVWPVKIVADTLHGGRTRATDK